MSSWWRRKTQHEGFLIFDVVRPNLHVEAWLDDVDLVAEEEPILRFLFFQLYQVVVIVPYVTEDLIYLDKFFSYVDILLLLPDPFMLFIKA
jgi:hypothetical protein